MMPCAAKTLGSLVTRPAAGESGTFLSVVAKSNHSFFVAATIMVATSCFAPNLGTVTCMFWEKMQVTAHSPCTA